MTREKYANHVKCCMRLLNAEDSFFAGALFQNDAALTALAA